MITIRSSSSGWKELKMVELVGDICRSSNLIVPVHEGTYTGISGEIFLSGSKIWLNVDGVAVEEVTSS